MIDLRHLQHVVALADHGSYRKAAAAVHLSQPALTKSVQQAERHYGVQLFDRRARPVVPTAFGRVVVNKARQVLSEVDSISADLGSLSQCDSGHLTIGAGPVMTESVVPQALAHMLTKYAGLTFRVSVGNWQELDKALHEDSIDLYIAAIDEDEPPKGVEVIPIISPPVVWFCRPGHALARQKRLRCSDLMAHPIVVPALPAWTRHWLDAVQRECGETLVLHTISENYSLIKQMVRHSDSVSAATRFVIADELRRRVLVELPVLKPEVRIHAGIVYRRDRTLSPAAHAFIQEILGMSPNRVACPSV